MTSNVNRSYYYKEKKYTESYDLIASLISPRQTIFLVFLVSYNKAGVNYPNEV